MTVLATSRRHPCPNIPRRSLYQEDDCVSRIDETRVFTWLLVVDRQLDA